MRTRGERIALVVGVVAASLAALVPPAVGASFRDVFADFGVELPFITAFVLHHSYWLWLLPLAVVAVWLAWPRPKQRAVAACVVGCGSLALSIAVAFVAMYLPVYQLNASVAL